MRISFLTLSMLGLLAACGEQRQHTDDSVSTIRQAAAETSAATPLHPALPGRAPAAFAALPDRGELLRYDQHRPLARQGAYTWHPVELSEAHALRAVGSGEMAIVAPDGRLIRLRHERHVEHGDGNWTWVGR